MNRIKLLNNISNVINNVLLSDDYTIGEEIDNPTGILVRSANCQDMEINKELRAIARAGAGTNNIPLERCTQLGVAVFNTPGANANAVKELVISAMLISARNLIPAIEWCKGISDKGAEIPKLVESGKKQFVGSELLDKNLGVIGLGAIGAQVANESYLLGMQVRGYDPFISVEQAWGLSRAIKRSTDLDELLAESDYISMHIPLNEKTKYYLNAEHLAKAKPGMTLLNFSRGELVDDDAVLAALKEGRIRQYITDFPNEKLLGKEGIICIPHLGASTPESEINCALMAAHALKDYLENGNIRNSVNLPNCEMPRDGEMRMCVLHDNAPNMIGQFTNLLSEQGVNIDNMTNRSRGNIAYTIIDLNEKLSKSLQEQIHSLDNVIRATFL